MTEIFGPCPAVPSPTWAQSHVVSLKEAWTGAEGLGFLYQPSTGSESWVNQGAPLGHSVHIISCKMGRWWNNIGVRPAMSGIGITFTWFSHQQEVLFSLSCASRAQFCLPTQAGHRCCQFLAYPFGDLKKCLC